MRREAGLKIDPETAEVIGTYGVIDDPYGFNPDLQRYGCTGHLYFARAPGGVWVEFGDLPEAIIEALWNKHAQRREGEQD